MTKAEENIDLKPGDRIKVSGERQWWNVRAASERYVVCTRQAAFHPKGTLEYTVLDWHRGIRGPCNLIGQGYGDGSYSSAECHRMLAEFENVRVIGDVEWPELEVSHRNNVRIAVTKVDII